MSKQETEQPKYIWKSNGTLTEYGVSLIAKVPFLQQRIEGLNQSLTRAFRRIIDIEEEIYKLLKPNAIELLKDFIVIRSKGKVKKWDFNHLIEEQDDRFMISSLILLWDEWVESGVLGYNSVKTLRGGSIRYYFLNKAVGS